MLLLSHLSHTSLTVRWIAPAIAAIAPLFLSLLAQLHFRLALGPFLLPRSEVSSERRSAGIRLTWADLLALRLRTQRRRQRRQPVRVQCCVVLLLLC